MTESDEDFDGTSTQSLPGICAPRSKPNGGLSSPFAESSRLASAPRSLTTSEAARKWLQSEEGTSGGRCAAIRDRTPPVSATPEQLTCCTPAAPFQRGRLGCSDRVRFAGAALSLIRRDGPETAIPFFEAARRFQHRERSTCLSKHPEPGRPSKNRWRSFAGKRHTTLSFACSTALADATNMARRGMNTLVSTLRCKVVPADLCRGIAFNVAPNRSGPFSSHRLSPRRHRSAAVTRVRRRLRTILRSLSYVGSTVLHSRSAHPSSCYLQQS